MTVTDTELKHLEWFSFKFRAQIFIINIKLILTVKVASLMLRKFTL